MKRENSTAANPTWRKVGTARDNKGETWSVYQNTDKTKWFKAMPGTKENPPMGFGGAFVGLTDCVQGMGLQGFELSI